MRITRVDVSELFGNPTYNYMIELRHDPPITILHGPNGSGKTVIFQMLYGLFESVLRCRYIFNKYPFAEFRVNFENGKQVYILGEDHANNFDFECPVLYSSADLEEPFPIERLETEIRHLPASLRNRIAHGDGDEMDEFMSIYPESADDEEQLYIFSRRFSRSIDRPASGMGEPGWYRELISQLNIRLISTNRLQIRHLDQSERHGSRRFATRSSSAIQELSNQLRNQIQDVLIAAKNEEDTLNRTFPSRIVDAAKDNQATWPFDKVQPELEELKNERDRLADIGLFDAGHELRVAQYNDETLGTVLRIYIEDSKQKLKVYQELANRIEALKDIVQVMLSDKNIVFTRRGFEVRNEANTEIPLRALSSGEQHLIVLMYKLLFRNTRQADEPVQDELILIDEPEISLNILWQNQFVSTLEKICDINRSAHFDIIIATHSPDILNGRIDLLVPLQSQQQVAE